MDRLKICAVLTAVLVVGGAASTLIDVSTLPVASIRGVQIDDRFSEMAWQQFVFDQTGENPRNISTSIANQMRQKFLSNRVFEYCETTLALGEETRISALPAAVRDSVKELLFGPDYDSLVGMTATITIEDSDSGRCVAIRQMGKTHLIPESFARIE